MNVDGARDRKGTGVAPSVLLRFGTAPWLIGALAFASSGCPQWLPDDFELVGAAGAGSGGTGSGGTGSGGTGSGGTGSTAAGNGGGPAGGTGGASGSSGSSSTGGGSSGAGGSPSTCSDGSQNQGETGVDCGGPCSACSCTWSLFSAPHPITGLGLASAQSAWGPALSADALTLLFSSGSPEDLFFATRPTRDAPFSAASVLPGELNTEDDEGTAFISFDGRRLYFFTRDSEGDDRDIFVATRPDLTSAFGGALPVPGVNSTSSDHLPWLSRDELTIYFTSSRAGGEGGYDLWLATRAEREGSFGAPRALAELNTGDDDQGTSLTQDELTLFLASNRAGSTDIWMAVRPSRDDEFSTPTRVLELSSNSSELNVVISTDGRELFFSTDRAGQGHQLWRATRNCE